MPDGGGETKPLKSPGRSGGHLQGERGQVGHAGAPPSHNPPSSLPTCTAQLKMVFPMCWEEEEQLKKRRSLLPSLQSRPPILKTHGVVVGV